MTTFSIAEARGKFSEAINQAAYAKERVLLTKNGKNFAALVPIEDLKLLERIEDESDIRDAKIALADAKKNGGTISLEEFEASLKKKRK